MTADATATVESILLLPQPPLQTGPPGVCSNSARPLATLLRSLASHFTHLRM